MENHGKVMEKYVAKWAPCFKGQEPHYSLVCHTSLLYKEVPQSANSVSPLSLTGCMYDHAGGPL